MLESKINPSDLKAIVCIPNYEYCVVNAFNQNVETCARGRFVINLFNFDVMSTSHDNKTSAVSKQQETIQKNINKIRDEIPMYCKFSKKYSEVFKKLESSQEYKKANTNQRRKLKSELKDKVVSEIVKTYDEEIKGKAEGLALNALADKEEYQTATDQDKQKMFVELQPKEYDNLINQYEKNLKDLISFSFIRGHSINGKKGGSGKGFATALIPNSTNSQHFKGSELFISNVAQHLNTYLGSDRVGMNQVNKSSVLAYNPSGEGVLGLLFETEFLYGDQGHKLLIPEKMCISMKVVHVPITCIGSATPDDSKLVIPENLESMVEDMSKRMRDYVHNNPSFSEQCLKWDSGTSKLVVELNCEIPLLLRNVLADVKVDVIDLSKHKSETCDDSLVVQPFPHVKQGQRTINQLQDNINKIQELIHTVNGALKSTDMKEDELRGLLKDVTAALSSCKPFDISSRFNRCVKASAKSKDIYFLNYKSALYNAGMGEDAIQELIVTQVKSLKHQAKKLVPQLNRLLETLEEKKSRYNPNKPLDIIKQKMNGQHSLTF